MRSTNCSFDISSEKNATPIFRLRVHRGIGADVERQRRFSHAGASRDDDQVGGLEAGGDPVEVGKAGGDAGDQLAFS